MVSRELEKECIVVFDEAHNIDNVCIEALSINLRQHTLRAARGNITKLENVRLGRRPARVPACVLAGGWVGVRRIAPCDNIALGGFAPSLPGTPCPACTLWSSLGFLSPLRRRCAPPSRRTRPSWMRSTSGWSRWGAGCRFYILGLKP